MKKMATRLTAARTTQPRQPIRRGYLSVGMGLRDGDVGPVIFILGDSVGKVDVGVVEPRRVLSGAPRLTECGFRRR
jgi:hypothetical protein